MGCLRSPALSISFHGYPKSGYNGARLELEKEVFVPAELHTILVVDDEPVIQKFIASILSQQGYRVLEACHAVHALQLCKQYPDPIHLLLTDVLMPHMNGRVGLPRFHGHPRLSLRTVFRTPLG